jgi:hypothetical protein
MELSYRAQSTLVGSRARSTPVTDVYFPNGGVFSVTNEMRE